MRMLSRIRPRRHEIIVALVQRLQSRAAAFQLSSIDTNPSLRNSKGTLELIEGFPAVPPSQPPRQGHYFNRLYS